MPEVFHRMLPNKIALAPPFAVIIPIALFTRVGPSKAPEMGQGRNICIIGMLDPLLPVIALWDDQISKPCLFLLICMTTSMISTDVRRKRWPKMDSSMTTY